MTRLESRFSQNDSAIQFQLVVLHMRRKELPDVQHSCTGIAGSQPVSLVVLCSHIRKDLGVAEKVYTQLK